MVSEHFYHFVFMSPSQSHPNILSFISKLICSPPPNKKFKTITPTLRCYVFSLCTCLLSHFISVQLASLSRRYTVPKQFYVLYSQTLGCNSHIFSHGVTPQ